MHRLCYPEKHFKYFPLGIYSYNVYMWVRDIATVFVVKSWMLSKKVSRVFLTKLFSRITVKSGKNPARAQNFFTLFFQCKIFEIFLKFFLRFFDIFWKFFWIFLENFQKILFENLQKKFKKCQKKFQKFYAGKLV